ncbi:hypothetical protein BLGI_4634 [Brevibacillus laterosporus GI-9]|nr:hypothetical protein BLGI_4634 [Brevibacillus laterosporus GI-9]
MVKKELFYLHPQYPQYVLKFYAQVDNSDLKLILIAKLPFLIDDLD